ncbi:MAG TPA: hypothetical protein VGD78_01875 [Chthoniobacterales bacterium]
MKRLIVSMLLAGGSLGVAVTPLQANPLDVTIRGNFAAGAPATGFSAPNAPFAITFRTEAHQTANPMLTCKDLAVTGLTYVLDGKTVGVTPQEDGMATRLSNYAFQHLYVNVPSNSPGESPKVDVLAGGIYYTLTHNLTELGVTPGTYVLDDAIFTNGGTAATIASGTLTIAQAQ